MSGLDSELIDRFYECMAGGDIDAMMDLYVSDALVIRFDGASAGVAEIRGFLTDVLERHQPYALHSIDQVTRVGDVLMWDAMVNTSNGIIQTTEVLVLDDAGKITRHIPGVRGYWGL